LSELISLSPGNKKALTDAEQALYDDPTDPLVNWGSEEYERWLADASWIEISVERREISDKRLVTAALVDRWFDPSREGGLGAKLEKVADGATREQITREAQQSLAGATCPWKSLYLIVTARPPRSA